jgi:hypothetical protein
MTIIKSFIAASRRWDLGNTLWKHFALLHLRYLILTSSSHLGRLFRLEFNATSRSTGRGVALQVIWSLLRHFEIITYYSY